MVERLPCKEIVGGSSPSIGSCDNSDDRYIGGTISRERLLHKIWYWGLSSPIDYRDSPLSSAQCAEQSGHCKNWNYHISIYLSAKCRTEIRFSHIDYWFAYLPSVEKAPWIVSAVHAKTHLCGKENRNERKSMNKSCQSYGNFHDGNHVMIAGRWTYIAVQNR